jgi:two-component system response regulator FixJ
MAAGVVISIVDDDESLRTAIKRLIKSIGLGVEDFATAEEYLNSDSSQDSACLIVDLRLPEMSGLELQSRLLTSNRRVPIIFISANGDGHARTRALEAGAVDFLQKPFSENDLFRAINSALFVHSSGAFINQE